MNKIKKSLICICAVLSLVAMNIMPVMAEPYVSAEWYQPAVAAIDNIHDAMYMPYSAKSFKNGTYLQECLNGNIEPAGIMIYLDFGYFTGYVDQFKVAGLIPADYQLPAKPYSMVKTGKTYKAGVYNAPYAITDCPEAQARLDCWYTYYTTGQYTVPDSGYVPKYQRDLQAVAVPQ